MRPRVLILGASGMLGHKLCEVFGGAPEFEVHATTRRGTCPAGGITLHEGVDLSAGSSALGPLLERTRPDIVLNAVGAVKQKDLHARVDETFLVNGTLPHLLALLNPNPAGRLVHVSTDCVFSGARGAYREADPPDAEDLYGRSKAAGEVAYGPHLTVRTSIIGFERQGHLGLLSWLLSRPRGSTVPGYVHAIYSGLPTITLARTLRHVLARPEPVRGLYHVASEPISKYELLQRVNQALDLGLRIEPDEQVHMDRSLDDAQFRAVSGTGRPDWAQLIEDLAADYLANGYDLVYRRLRDAAAE